MGVLWFLIPVSLAQLVSILLNLLTLYAYYKLHILKKPPGTLIFIQLIILLIKQVNLFIYIFVFALLEPILHCSINEYLARMAYAAAILYQICIAFELFMRVRSYPMGQNYFYRKVAYHIISLGGAITILMISVVYSSCSDRLYIENSLTR